MTSPDDDAIHQPASAGLPADDETKTLLPQVSTTETLQVVEANKENEKASKSLPPISTIETSQVVEANSVSEPVRYRLYKQRFVGLVALVFLNIVTGLSWPWFGPIANNAAADFNITLNEVNWLGNILSCVYLPTSLLMPSMVSKYGINRCCQIGAASLILSAWIRYAGTAPTLSGKRAYPLLIIGQAFAGIAQPIFQVIGPKFSENWFDLKGRTTATMLISIANPVGAALGQLISPLSGTTKQSILVLGIVSTAVTPFAFFVGSAPPTPPTYAGSKESQSLFSLLHAMIGKVDPSSDAYMSRQSRADFAFIAILFGIYVAAANTFSILTAEIFEPVGYDATISGLMGACLLLAGLVAAAVTAPLFDRVFTYHLGLSIKILVPPLAGAWLSLIWAVKPGNTAGLFVIMAIIGVTSLTLLAAALELCADLTKNADASAAILWFLGNSIGIIFVLAQGALRASPNATPPLNMHRALIFNGVIAMVAAGFVIPLKGKQDRKRLDEEKQRVLNNSDRKAEEGSIPIP